MLPRVIHKLNHINSQSHHRCWMETSKLNRPHLVTLHKIKLQELIDGFEILLQTLKKNIWCLIEKCFFFFFEIMLWMMSSLAWLPCSAIWFQTRGNPPALGSWVLGLLAFFFLIGMFNDSWHKSVSYDSKHQRETVCKIWWHVEWETSTS